MRKFTLLTLLAVVAACGDTPVDPLGPGAGSELISDANQNGGNDAFFWLAPIVKNNTYAGVFNPQLKPLVEICELNTAETPHACDPAVDPLATWSMSTGLTLSLTAPHHYGFEWHTDQTATNFEATYRIYVFLTESKADTLGFADVQFFSNGAELQNLQTGDVIELRDGRTLPGRFRIEKGASCDGDTDCGEAVIGTGGGTVTTASGFAGVEFPEGAAGEDLLITIRRIDPGTQPWGRCLPTGLRQEEGCYEFDAARASDGTTDVQFNSFVTVGVCIDPQALRPDRLLLHKYDPELPAQGVVELEGTTENFLTCDNFAYQEDPSSLLGRFARAAGRLLSPVARLVGGTPLYATDAGRAGLTDAFSYIGWAEPVTLSVESAPSLLIPGSTVPVTLGALTGHNHGQTALDASGHVLRLEYTDPAEVPFDTVLGPDTTDLAGSSAPDWTLTDAVGLHTLAVSTRMKIELSPGDSLVVQDPTDVLTVQVGGYQFADDCAAGEDCVVQVVDGAGATVLTSTGFAGVQIPAGAVDGPIAIKIARVEDPSLQPWGRCLPTGLRQVEGCYEYDTEPSLDEVNQQDAFNDSVVVEICMAPDAREQYLTLHKYDPEYPDSGVVELAGAPGFFEPTQCDQFAAIPNTLFERLASAGRRLLSPVASAVLPRPLYATDAGRAGLTDAFSFIGWAEPVTLTLATEQNAVDGAITDVVVTATTAHNHDQATTPLPALPADGHRIRFEYTEPSTVVSIDTITTDTNGQARISLTTAGGTHNVKVSTQQEIEIETDVIAVSGAGSPGMFAAPHMALQTQVVKFLVPDPTLVAESGILVQGLVSRWDADNSGARFADRIGPNHGTPRGTVDGTAAGVEGSGFRFDGTGGIVSAPAAHIGDAAEFTVSAWVSLDPAGSPWSIQRFVTVGGDEGEKAVLRQESSPDGATARQAHFYGGFGTDPDGIGADLRHVWVPSQLIAGCWQHLAGTYDGSQLVLYRNGKQIGTTAVDAAVADDSHLATHVDLGALLGEAFTGTIDEVEVHNRALSASEVASLAGQHTPTCAITTGFVGGVVTDAETGAPIPDVGVTIEADIRHFTRTDASGRYQLGVLNPLPLGSYTVLAQVTGYDDATQTVDVREVGSFVGADFAMTPGVYDVGGTVYDAVIGIIEGGIPAATVTLTNTETGSSQQTTTSSSGGYGFLAQPAGQYTLHVSGSGYHSESESFVLGNDLPTLNVPLWPVDQQGGFASDPGGDVKDASLDLLQGGGITDGRTLTLEASGPSGVFSAAGVVWLIDADENPATGFDLTGLGLIGADYRITAGGVQRWNGTAFGEPSGSLPLTVTDDGIARTYRLTVQHEQMGPEDSNMALKVVTQVAPGEAADMVPDPGTAPIVFGPES